MFWNMVLRIFIVNAIILIVFFLASTLLGSTLWQFFYTISPSLADFIRNAQVLFLFGFMLASCVIIVYLTLSKSIRYTEEIVESIDQVFQKEESLTTLPEAFKDIETKLNTIKYENMRNEHLAREAEQRKNDLVVYLAHDLKTPLTSVIGYLSLLNEAEGLPEELQKKYLSIALDKSQRLEDLINEFFEITRFNLQSIVLERSVVNLSVMLMQLADEFYPMLESKNLTINQNIPAGISLIGDADKLARVFDNLLRNAINYSFENSQIDLGVTQTDSQIIIGVRNRGVMIPEHQLSRIFEKFYRLDSARSSRTGGSGLGLAIAKEIVEMHHGTITARSNSEYTEFIITLPRQV